METVLGVLMSITLMQNVVGIQMMIGDKLKEFIRKSKKGQTASGVETGVETVKSQCQCSCVTVIFERDSNLYCKRYECIECFKKQARHQKGGDFYTEYI